MSTSYLLNLSRTLIVLSFSILSLQSKSQGVYVVTDLGEIYNVNPENCSSELITEIQDFSDIALITDIAVNPNNSNELYAVNDHNQILILYLNTGQWEIINEDMYSTDWNGFNSMVFGNEEYLYLCSYGSPSLWSFNLNTGQWTDMGYTQAVSGGDLTFMNGYLYLSGADNELMQISFDPFGATLIGFFDVPNIFGIITYGNQIGCNQIGEQSIYALSGSSIYSLNISNAQTELYCENIIPLGTIYGAASSMETGEPSDIIDVEIIASDSDPCAGEMVNFTINIEEEVVLYDWFNNAATSSIDLSISEPTLVEVQVTTALGCTGQGTLYIEPAAPINPSFTVVKTECPTSCNGSIISNSENIEIYWQQQNTTGNLSNLCIGSYTYNSIDYNGCSSQGSVDLSANNYALEISGPNVACYQSNVELTSTFNGDSNLEFNWVPLNVSSSELSLEATSDIMITLNAISENNCAYHAEHFVDVIEPMSLSIDLDENIYCQGECISPEILELNDPSQVSWSIDGMPTEIPICNAAVGDHELSASVSFAQNCVQEVEYSGIIQVEAPPIISLTTNVNYEDEVLEYFVSVEENSEVAVFVNDIFYSNELSGTLQLYLNENITIKAIALSNLGCTSVAVVENNIEMNPTFYIPNVFSPNDDGINDVWKVIGSTNNLRLFSCSIFNRWGQEVFSSNDINDVWTGGYKEYYCPDGVYFYQIKAGQSPSSTKIFSGHITLLR
jgi:gliding motility-associated-like protein